MIRTVSETGSTNADLAAALRAGESVDEGHWLIADRQTAGRGRQARQWFDGHGNFMGSTVVRTHDRDPSPASLALVAGLALYEAILPFIPNPAELSLKWPNDLMLGGAKLAGILLERQGEAIIVGIGVNLAVAPEIADRRTVALSEFGPAPDRDTFARSLAASLDVEFERWRSFGVEPIVRRWESVAHPQGTLLNVIAPGEEGISGRFAGLSADGALRLQLAGGEERVIHAGDVMLANEEG